MSELLRLTRALRARAELVDESDWASLPGADRPAPGSPAFRAPGSAAPPAAASADGSKSARLAALSREVLACRLCPLGSHRLNPAFGVGAPDAKVVFIGEGPGFEEDRQGEPFVGKAGQLLDKILAAIGLSRQAVYIANVVKCHPMVDPSSPDKRGNDRPPSPEEMEACRRYLEAQIAIIRPRFLVSLGATSARALLRTQSGITRLRGKWYDYGDGMRLLPTYHPAALLRNPEFKRDVWNDMKMLKAALEEAP